MDITKAMCARDIKCTERKMKEEAAKSPHYRSVYVCRGLPGDPLYIDGQCYVLINNFLAATLEQVLTPKV